MTCPFVDDPDLCGFQACFTAVYGPPPGSSRPGPAVRKSSLGVCGVCRRPMKIGDGDGGKTNSESHVHIRVCAASDDD